MTVDFVQVYDSVYSIQLFPGPILRDGRQWKTYVDHAEEHILISDTIPHPDRMTAAAHAVSLAWKTSPVSPSVLLENLPFVPAED
jgi:hypothetical protein